MSLQRPVAVLCLLLAPVAGSLAASLTLQANGQTIANLSSGTVVDSHPVNTFKQQATGPVSDGDTGQAAVASGTFASSVFSATIDYGLFKTSAQAHALTMTQLPPALGDSSQADMDVMGIVSDTLTFSSPGGALAGTVATVTAHLQVLGGLSAASADTASAGWRVAVTPSGGTNVLLGSEIGGANQNGTYVGDALGSQTITFNVTMDTPITLTQVYELQVAVLQDLPGTGDATATFSNTILWSGISQVVDEHGNPVQFSLSSGSGVDWTQPVSDVPLPAAGWLLLAALGTLTRRGVRAA